jgi:hypothetical protein
MLNISLTAFKLSSFVTIVRKRLRCASIASLTASLIELLITSGRIPMLTSQIGNYKIIHQYLGYFETEVVNSIRTTIRTILLIQLLKKFEYRPTIVEFTCENDYCMFLRTRDVQY